MDLCYWNNRSISEGRTQPEKEYILKTVLAHLPKVTGSEEDMQIFINQELGHNESSSDDEFFNSSNLGNGHYGTFNTQRNYLITIRGYLRDRHLKETFKEFMKWLCRLSKRVMVETLLIKVTDYPNAITIDNYNDRFTDMYEWENNWTDYLMWDYIRDEEGNLCCGKPTESIKCYRGDSD